VCVCGVVFVSWASPGLGMKNSRLDIQTRTHTHTLKHAVGNTYQNQSPKRATALEGCSVPSVLVQTALIPPQTRTQRKREGPDCLSAQSSTSFCLFFFFLSLSLSLVLNRSCDSRVWCGRSDRGDGICCLASALVCVLHGDKTETPWLLWGRATTHRHTHTCFYKGFWMHFEIL